MGKVKVIREDIEKKLSLNNTYKLLNDQLDLLLTPQEKNFVQELQDFNCNLEPKIDFSKDVYVLFPELGKQGYIQRLNPWKNFAQAGCKYEMLLGINLAMLDPELDLSRLASGILCGNPTFQHGGTEELNKVQDALLSGQKIGCITITEPNHGSDSVNMETHCIKNPDSYSFDGTKIFTTNGPKADYFLGYGCLDNAKPRETMIQAMVSREMGVQTERLNISAVPRVHIGKTYFKAKIPNNYITGPEGHGYDNLFEGLVPERLSIVGSSLGIAWGALLNSILYCNLREQFGQKIMKYQAISFPLSDLLVRLTSATMSAFKIAEIYDEKILHTKEKTPDAIKASAQWSSEIKYLCAKIAAETVYECQQYVGGISVTDNTRLSRLWGVSNIQEVIGGARNIMLYILSGNIGKALKIIEGAPQK
jgi:alkylation response protein AidB-like acyl-CoA dehydrogenase